MSSFSAAQNVKMVLLGQTMVGKTSLVNVIHGGKFIPEQTATVGACFQIKSVVVKGTPINIHLWDTAGQERFKALTPMYYRDAHIALLVYSVENRDSFNEIQNWYRGLVNDCLAMPQVVLVANKSDLMNSDGAVTEDEGQELAQRLDAKFFLVSARCDEPGVHKMFDEVAEMAEVIVNSVNTADQDPIPRENGGRKPCC